MTYDGVISGGGSLAQNGAGTLILTGANAYTGGTTISAGMLLEIGDGSIRRQHHAETSWTMPGRLIFTNRSDDDAITYGGLISGTGGMTQLGTGTLILTANNTYTGGTTISDGTLQIGNGGVIGSVTGDILDNAAALAFDRSDAVTYSQRHLRHRQRDPTGCRAR